MEYGVAINKENRDSGGTALSNACKNGNETIVKDLIEHGTTIH